MACRANGSCLAVGTYWNQLGPEAFILASKGGRWTASRVELPASLRGRDPFLAALSCSAGGRCEAVGHYSGRHQVLGLIVTWASTGLRFQSVAAPRGGSDLFLGSVSCPRSGGCTALGRYAGHGSTELAATVSGGSNQALTAPVTRDSVADDNGPQFAGLACASAVNCAAIGTAYSTAGHRQVFILSESGGHWSAIPFLRNIHPLTYPSSIVSGPGGLYVAVGYYLHAQEIYPLLLMGSGRTWRLMRARQIEHPLGGSEPSFSAVACPTSDRCLVGGEFYSRRRGPLALVETGTGRRWRAYSTPLPRDAGTPPSIGLQYVSCADDHHCTALGALGGDSVTEETLSGRVWHARLLTFPASSGSSIQLSGLDCPTRILCAAVTSSQSVLVKHYGRWTAVSAPDPARHRKLHYPLVQHMACTVQAWCAGIGSYFSGPTTELSAVFRLIAGRVSDTIVPSALGAKNTVDSRFTAITCRKRGPCLAVGVDRIQPGTGGQGGGYPVGRPTALMISRSKIRAQPVTLPADAAGPSLQAPDLTAVACPAHRGCVATGLYLTKSRSYKLVILRESKGHWRPVRLLSKSRRPIAGMLTSVSCRPNGSCAAIGIAHQSGSSNNTLPLEAWGSGGVWRVRQGRAPSNATRFGNSLTVTGIDCVSAGPCVATGLYEGKNSSGRIFFLKEEHGAWKTTRGLMPRNAARLQNSDTTISAPDCGSRIFCVAVGTYVTTIPGTYGSPVEDAFIRERRS